jgi:uncharacterized protein YmfQ (DUF2313 family)
MKNVDRGKLSWVFLSDWEEEVKLNEEMGGTNRSQRTENFLLRTTSHCTVR